jgi:hypothetical protein
MMRGEVLILVDSLMGMMDGERVRCGIVEEVGR